MNIELSAELKELQDRARKFALEQVLPGAVERDLSKEYPKDLVAAAAKEGWCGCLIPKEFGGSELGNLGQAVVLEELAYAEAGFHVALSVHNSLLSSPVTRFGTDQLKAEYLSRIASGELIGAYLLTEPGAGSDAASLRTQAIRDGDEWVINGDKMWITTGDLAQLGVVFAKTNTDEGVRNTDAISAFLVDLSDPGVTFGKAEPKLGLKSSRTVAVFLKDVRVPSHHLLGEEGRGFHMAMDFLNGGRIGISMQAIGVARRALDIALKEVAKRERRGRPMQKSQLVQFQLAEVATKIAAARHLAYQAAALRDAKKPHIGEASMAKLFSTQMCNETCRDLVALLGEAGYSSELELERLLRDARVCELYEGTSEVQKIVIAKQLLASVQK